MDNISYIILLTTFILALAIAMTLAPLVKPKTSSADLHEFMADVCEVYENPFSYKFKTYNLAETTLRNGEIVLGESVWVYCSCCEQQDNIVLVPIQCQQMKVNGLTTLTLENRGGIVVIKKS